jgi:transcriptional regulator with XRE-family HTH domain
VLFWGDFSGGHFAKVQQQRGSLKPEIWLAGVVLAARGEQEYHYVCMNSAGDDKKQDFPYKQLGSLIKGMRQKKQESLDEVSGAIEIDVDMLSDIECGARRPGEDILMLLISYFAVKEEDAVEIWEMAGYSKQDDAPAGPHHHHHHQDTVQSVLVMAMDVRIVYTDMAHISNNKYGLTINFMQSDGIGSQPLAVSRVGMSREHAENLLHLLEASLRPPAPKLLPAPKTKTEDTPDV